PRPLPPRRSSDLSLPRAEKPCPPVPRLIGFPPDPQEIRELLKRRLVQELSTRNAVGAETVARLEFPVTLCQHAFPVLSLFVHRGIQDDDSPSRAQAAARFLQSSMVVRGIVVRGIEDREIGLRI